MMEAIPTTRGKDGKFLRPEMTTLDGMRALLWEDLPRAKRRRTAEDRRTARIVRRRRRGGRR